MAMGWENTSFCAGLTENRTRLSRHHPRSDGTPPLPWAGVWVEGPCVPSYSARLSPANGCLGSPRMTTLPCSAAGIMSPLCLRPTPTSGCNHALFCWAGVAMGRQLCDVGDSGQTRNLLWHTASSVAGRLGCLALAAVIGTDPLIFFFLKLACHLISYSRVALYLAQDPSLLHTHSHFRVLSLLSVSGTWYWMRVLKSNLNSPHIILLVWGQGRECLS